MWKILNSHHRIKGLVYWHIFFLLPLIFLIQAFFSFSFGQEEELSDVLISAKTDQAQVKVGEQLTFTLVLNYKKGIDVTLPDIGPQIKGLRIVEFGADPIQTEGERNIQSRWYKVMADLSGSYILPVIEIDYLGADGKKKKVKTTEIFIEAITNLNKDKNGEEKDIRDIKAIIKAPFKLSLLDIIILVLLLMGCLSIGILLLFLKRKKTSPVIPLVPPHEKALKDFATLLKSDLLEKNEFKPFHFQLSHILRTYIEGRFEIWVTDMTTQEIVKNKQLENLMSKEDRAEMVEILEKGDLVKFTDFSLGQELSLQLGQQCQNFVHKTKVIEKDDHLEESVI
jgi:hypothetical protein